jgi:hypothetical protein
VLVLAVALAGCGLIADSRIQVSPATDSCEAYANPSGELIEQLGERVDIQEQLGLDGYIHLQTGIIDENQVVWAVGSGGLYAIDVGAQPHRALGAFLGPGSYLFDDVALTQDPNLIAAVNSAYDTLLVIDISDMNNMVATVELIIDGALSVARSGEYLYVGTLGGALFTLSLRDPATPRVLNRLEGVGTAWELLAEGDVLYAASDRQGVVTIDLSDPEAPSIAGVTPTSGAALSLTRGGSPAHLYVAEASAGLEVLSLEDEYNPMWVASPDVGQSLVSARADGELLWVADLEGVLLLDISDPSQPTPIAWEATPEWAMGAVPLPGQDAALVAASSWT